MRIDLENFGTGWIGLTLGLSQKDIDELIQHLQHLRESQGHFHLSSDFIGSEGVGDIEVYFDEDHEENMSIL